MKDLAAGLDIGSTNVKLLVVDSDGNEVTFRSAPTPWQTDAAGATVIDAEALLAAVRHVFTGVAEDLAPMTGVQVRAIATTGMGETGFLLDERGTVLAPGYAWFDKSGADQLAAIPAELQEQFGGRTGIPLGVQVSVVKMLHLAASGISLADAQWMNVPDYLAHRLGGRRTAERSLASRTGLIDQDTGQPWADMLAYLGAGPTFFPPLEAAGTPLGLAQADWVPEIFRGAEVSVAGHDHLASARSGGIGLDNSYHVSMGTAEVLLRIIDNPLNFAARTRLTDHLINCVEHVVAGQYAVVAGVKTGLVQKRMLNMLGIDRDGTAALDAATLAVPATAAQGVRVTGARNDDGILGISVHTDDVSPAILFRAALEHGNAEIARLLDVLSAELEPAESSLLTGGWTSWESVVEARSRVLPGVRVSERPQDTAYGAALCALEIAR